MLNSLKMYGNSYMGTNNCKKIKFINKSWFFNIRWMFKSKSKKKTCEWEETKNKMQINILILKFSYE